MSSRSLSPVKGPTISGSLFHTYYLLFGLHIFHVPIIVKNYTLNGTNSKRKMKRASKSSLTMLSDALDDKIKEVSHSIEEVLLIF
jgi:hypothetical protein